MSALAGPETKRSLLSLDRIGRTYGGQPAVRALSTASFTVDAAEALAIIGRSGSGKSTLLNVLGLLDTATEGEYRVAGVQVADLPDHDRTLLRAAFFGFVFQLGFRTS